MIIFESVSLFSITKKTFLQELEALRLQIISKSNVFKD